MKTNRPVTLRQEQQHERALFTAILALKSVEECRSFFRDLCTPTELQAMADRWPSSSCSNAACRTATFIVRRA